MPVSAMLLGTDWTTPEIPTAAVQDWVDCNCNVCLRRHGISEEAKRTPKPATGLSAGKLPNGTIKVTVDRGSLDASFGLGLEKADAGKVIRLAQPSLKSLDRLGYHRDRFVGLRRLHLWLLVVRTKP